ncbi:DUF6612 family protein [Piscibacillus sp. B03]|uniref:DUF6612 family protein n=1 Tax=Piscibacillus sp. B03 TaxID=3457430 RepID=UPI003FCDF744
MKKFVVMVAVILLLLAGCSDDEQQTSSDNATEVFEKISNNLEEVQDYSMNYSLNQEVVVPEINEPIIVEQEESTYIEMDPFQFLTEVKATGLDLSIVYKDEQLYSLQQDDSLQPISDENISQLPELIEKQRHLPVLIELFQTMEDQFELKKGDEYATLVMNGEGEDFQSYVKNQLETATFGGSELPIKEAQLDVKEVKVEIVINQDTYEVVSINTSFSSEQNETSISQEIKRDYTDYNQQAKEIPEE